MIEKREVVNKNISHHNKKLKSICDRVKLNNIFVDNDNDRKDIKYKKQNNNAFNTQKILKIIRIMNSFNIQFHSFFKKKKN